jgi:hypothetical protein
MGDHPKSPSPPTIMPLHTGLNATQEVLWSMELIMQMSPPR